MLGGRRGGTERGTSKPSLVNMRSHDLRADPYVSTSLINLGLICELDAARNCRRVS